MNREKFQRILIILLFVLNAATIFFVIYNRRRPELGNKFDRTVIGKLELTGEQIRQFDSMKTEHHQNIMRLDTEMRSTYEKYFYLLTDTGNSNQKDSLEMILSQKQKEKIQITYNHFDDLKSICSREQQEKFKELVPMLMHVINPQKNPPPPRRN